MPIISAVEKTVPSMIHKFGYLIEQAYQVTIRVASAKLDCHQAYLAGPLLHPYNGRALVVVLSVPVEHRHFELQVQVLDTEEGHDVHQKLHRKLNLFW